MKKLLQYALFIGIASLVTACTSKREGDPKILVFSKTAGYVHESIPDGVAAISKLGAENGFAVDTTSDAANFNEENLAQYAAVVFMSTTGDLFDRTQEVAFERYIQAGGGYVGIHAAADAEYDWRWYGRLAGAYFQSHPAQQEAIFNIVDKSSPATSFFPEATWKRKDELYNYKMLNPDVKVLITIDEKSYEGGENGENHPMAWYHKYDGGRAFYTGLGHTKESFTEELFLKHVLGGIQYAIGDNAVLNFAKAHSEYPPDQDRFSKTILSYGNFYEPTEMTVLPSLDILLIQRRGEILRYSQEDKMIKQVGFINVYHASSTPGVNAEEGMLGLAKDPNFEKNHYVYIYHSPADTSVNRLSRFTFENDTILPESEKVILELYSQRQICCHTGGSIAFGGDGLMYISTGDNSTPFNAPKAPFVNSGYAPLNDLEGKEQYDARRSSGNTNDLRGKILRIKVNEDGSYDIPEGNLFPKGTPKTRPEIFTMGHRNPYRISVDQKTGTLYWGDVGPDAGFDSLETRGPRGYDEVGQAKKAGNFGWPLFVGNNYAYRRYDYATGQSGDFFDPAKPVNDSRNNTGLKDLPPAMPAMIWYPSAASPDFPQVGTGGRNPMAGPVYYTDMFPKETRLPDYYNGKLIIYEWIRGWIKAVSFDKDGNFDHMEPVAPGIKLNNCIDMEVGPDGKLYILEYGTGWFQQNENSSLSRIDYNYGNRPPKIESIAVNKTSGGVPFKVEIKTNAMDPDGDPLEFVYDFGDGKLVESKDSVVSYTFDKVGDYEISVEVKDNQKNSTYSEGVKVYAGNTSPELSVVLDGGNKSFYFPGIGIPYHIDIKDTEDKEVAAENLKVSVDYLEGFDMAGVTQGHFTGDAGGKGKSLTERLDCKSCHKQEEKSIGPSYRQVSEKYFGVDKNEAAIVKSIINGSAGAWGEAQMPAHPALNPDDAKSIAQYIIRLAADAKAATLLPMQGKIVPPVGENKNATMIVKASYTDKGGENIKPLSGQTAFYLPDNDLEVTGSEEKKGFTGFSNRGANLLVVPKERGYFALNDIDLTGVKSINLQANYRNEPAYNITLEIRLDAEDGPLLGSGSFQKSKEERRGTIPVPIKAVTDGKKHKLYFVSIPKEEGADVPPGITIRSTLFQAGK